MFFQGLISLGDEVSAEPWGRTHIQTRQQPRKPVARREGGLEGTWSLREVSLVRKWYKACLEQMGKYDTK